MKRRILVAAVVVLAACSNADAPLAPIQSGNGIRPQVGSVLAPGLSMIVTLQAGAEPLAVASDHGVLPDYVYTTVLNGFAGAISDAARSGLLRDSRVVSIDQSRDFAIEGGIQPGPTWGLDRIDQRSSSLDHAYVFDATGKGVTAYILDTGIRYTHIDFEGRATFGYDAFGGNGADCQGHGTHVAGTVGGHVYGVAKEVSLVSVRVLNCSGAGTTATLLAGLDWITAHAALPAVANMSLGGGADTLVDAAIERAMAAGVSFAVAAGNSAADACNYSPARVPGAMTVGATSATDASASWSNWGDCVDWFAPGVSITSDAYSADDATAVKSGTSMASPHTAGAAALYLEVNPGATPQQVASGLAAMTTKGIVTSAISVHNDLLYTRIGGTSGGTGNLWPTSSFTAACTNLDCAFTDRSSDTDGTIMSWAWDFGDGSTATTRDAAHSYATDGSFLVTLTVKDNAGGTGVSSRSVSVSGISNQAPSARFTFSCSVLTCTFTDGSTDPDGSIASWTWDFGDGATAVAQSGGDQLHSFTAGGSYRVQLTVTDNQGTSSTIGQDVPVGLVLALVGYRQKGKQSIDLSWTGAATPTVSLYLNGVVLATIPNSGKYTWQTGSKGHGTYTFKVCEVGTTMCSRDESVSF